MEIVLKIKYLYILIFITFMPLFSSIEFADYLYAKKDYFRAITEYKRVKFNTSDEDTKKLCSFSIAKSYYKSSKFKSSIRHLTPLLKKEESNKELVKNANLYVSLNFIGLKAGGLALDYLDQADQIEPNRFGIFYKGYLEAEKMNLKKSNLLFRQVYDNNLNNSLGKLSLELSEEVLKGSEINSKSPLVASIMSSIVPGSGQFYSGHYSDGLQSLIYVSSFALATFAAYRYDKEFGSNYAPSILCASVTATFYISNIIGAKTTAEFYNIKRRENFLKKIREKVFNIDPF